MTTVEIGSFVLDLTRWWGPPLPTEKEIREVVGAGLGESDLSGSRFHRGVDRQDGQLVRFAAQAPDGRLYVWALPGRSSSWQVVGVAWHLPGAFVHGAGDFPPGRVLSAIVQWDGRRLIRHSYIRDSEREEMFIDANPLWLTVRRLYWLARDAQVAADLRRRLFEPTGQGGVPGVASGLTLTRAAPGAWRAEGSVLSMNRPVLLQRQCRRAVLGFGALLDEIGPQLHPG